MVLEGKKKREMGKIYISTHMIKHQTVNVIMYGTKNYIMGRTVVL